MYKRSMLRFITISVFMLLLFAAAQISGAGEGFYEPRDRWGFWEKNYGQPTDGYGYVSPLVRKVQKLLDGFGYDVGAVDGSWGEKISLALKEFQKDSGIAETGWIDIDTKNILQGGKILPRDLIKKIQRVLGEKEYEPGPVDGKWGENSENALKKYQVDNNLRPTGLITPNLLDQLL